MAAIPLSILYRTAQRPFYQPASLETVILVLIAIIFSIVGIGGVILFNVARVTTLDKRSGTFSFRETFFLFPFRTRTAPLSEIHAIELTPVYLGEGLTLYRVDLRNSALKKIAWAGLFLRERRANALALEIQKFLGRKHA